MLARRHRRGVPRDGALHGKAEARAYFTELWAATDDWNFEVERILPVDGRVAVGAWRLRAMFCVQSDRVALRSRYPLGARRRYTRQRSSIAPGPVARQGVHACSARIR